MARVPCKHHLLLVAFFLFCFITTTARARNMPAAPKETDQKLVHDEQQVVKAKENGSPDVNVDELVSMDYTPATRKPPIHN
ncbi:hypothetical protein CCACVL1_26910 [Corchorus capsularis]|uniref:Uncharacterized protein n=2 Tax=Corchorus TaxID=93758 RepID=A0A1R3GCU1_COCAP|nr:hypothetical protein CCACVL1_26910 [Corchorus capsularis]OMO83702.1 hypothetical protein COLO4_22370 [Corchorus olitorius]